MTTTCWFCHRPLADGETCRITLVRDAVPPPHHERAVEIPGCPDCASLYDAQLHGWSMTSCGCWAVTTGFTALLLCLVGALANLPAVALPGALLVPAAFAVWPVENALRRRREQYRPQGRLTHRATEHPEVSGLLDRGWRVKEPPPEASA
ncbi:hypothetical protein [Streptomyces sulfonofaciens]|uniref:hypothetical protein n=1 Tax=Streptomyces sulfonofaciens TaxID=68272 RepID=UPI00167A2F82|nr:hypothetical protein [Streptomyces sulfonofaciens]